MDKADLIIRAMFALIKGKGASVDRQNRFTDRALEAEYQAYCAWCDSRWGR